MIPSSNEIRFIANGKFVFGGLALCIWLCLSVICSQVTFAQSTQKVWIEFSDKAIASHDFIAGNPIYDSACSRISIRALARRQRAMHAEGSSNLITLEDAPIAESYLDWIRAMGIVPLAISRWTNSVSAEITDQQLRALRTLSFVKRIQPVLGRPIELPQPYSQIRTQAQPDIAVSKNRVRLSAVDCHYDSIIYHYGLALGQLTRINVPPLHAMGFDASGVLLGFFDTGFRWRVMDAVKTRHILSEYDYVFRDTLTANEADDDSGQDNHGSSVLSAATSYLPDSLVGPAYNADIMLAKTEDLRTETPKEEDNYAEALEVMEAKGVDVTSCSLGYFYFDSGYVSHNYSDMTGTVTIAARAASHAAKLGVLMVDAMGNNGAQTYSHMITPGDADGIISVGALNLSDTITDFSARGPTFDGRLKPEICAPGLQVQLSSVDGAFFGGTGTSFATPLVSSACALIMQTHPEATAQQIRAAVMKTGSHASLPDTAYGWGKINAYAAALELGTIIGPPKTTLLGNGSHVCVAMAAKDSIHSGRIIYSIGDFGPLDHYVQLLPAQDSNLYYADFPALPTGTKIRYVVEAKDGADTVTYLPRDAPHHVFSFNVKDSSLSVQNVEVHAADLGLSPNPAWSSLHAFTASQQSGKLTIIDVAGREMMSQSISAGFHDQELRIDALASGTYYVRFDGGSPGNAFSAQQKLVVIH
jgi:serine protease AprX